MLPIYCFLLACVDTPGWDDGTGQNCDDYRSFYCDDSYNLGSGTNYPERNCCNCPPGKQNIHNKSEWPQCCICYIQKNVYNHNTNFILEPFTNPVVSQDTCDGCYRPNNILPWYSPCWCQSSSNKGKCDFGLKCHHSDGNSDIELFKKVIPLMASKYQLDESLKSELYDLLNTFIYPVYSVLIEPEKGIFLPVNNTNPCLCVPEGNV